MLKMSKYKNIKTEVDGTIFDSKKEAGRYREIKLLLEGNKECEMLKILNKICNGWVTEYKFHPSRKWKFDFANPELKIACEQEGGVWVFGRHNRGKGFLNDMEKYNAATVMGWRVLRYPPNKIILAVEDIKQLCGA